jgi:outer membrane protein OmpA-like peptidoglycan-associated protein
MLVIDNGRGERGVMRFDTIFQLGLVVFLAISLAGCATTPSPGMCALIGGGVGAVGGGVAGGLYADNNDHRDHEEWEGAGIAAASTVVGAGVGYLVCSLMEEEPKPAPKPAPPAPRAAPPAPPPPPKPDVCTQMVRIHDIKFENDKAEIQPNASTVLDQTAGALEKCPDVKVRLTAYTDSNGSDAYNMKLSDRRANAVREYLEAHGVAAGRIESKGLGESNPIADNSTAEGRAENRRVEIEPIH